MYAVQQRCSATFHDLYPNVSSCIIDYTYRSNGPGGNFSHSDKLIVNTLQSPSLVAVVCYNPECTKGYFELNNAISKMTSKNETLQAGYLSCEGWDDDDKLYYCRCKLEYTIQIEYK